MDTKALDVKKIIKHVRKIAKDISEDKVLIVFFPAIRGNSTDYNSWFTYDCQCKQKYLQTLSPSPEEMFIEYEKVFGSIIDNFVDNTVYDTDRATALGFVEFWYYRKVSEIEEYSFDGPCEYEIKLIENTKTRNRNAVRTRIDKMIIDNNKCFACSHGIFSKKVECFYCLNEVVGEEMIFPDKPGQLYECECTGEVWKCTCKE